MKKLLIGLLSAGAVIVPAVALTIRDGGASDAKPALDGATPFIVRKAAASDEAGLRPMPVKAESNRASARASKVFDVPYTPDFTDFNSISTYWSFYNNDNDSYSWELDEKNGVLKCYAPTTKNNNNDWAVTPGINLGKDDVYTLTFSYGSQGLQNGRFEPSAIVVTMGTVESPSQHTITLLSDDNITYFWNGKMRTVTLTLPVEADGVYYIGFHNVSPKASYCLYIKDVRVEQNGSHSAPDAVGGLTVIPGAKGALNATVSMTAPAVDADGNDLDALRDVKLYRDDSAEPVKTFDSPAPGATLSFDDTGLSRGIHKYVAVASNEAGEGARAESSAYIGVDEPNTPTNIRASENGKDIVVMWDAATGKNGGYTGDDVTTYTIVRYDGDDTVVAQNISGNSFTDPGLNGAEKQSNIGYSITATTEAGTSEAGESNSLFVGAPYSLPLAEPFAYCSLKQTPWVMERINPGVFPTQWQLTPMGSLPSCPPTDGDDGMLAYVTRIGDWNLYQGNVTRMAAPTVDLSSASNPFVSFKLFHYDTTETSQEYDDETEETVTVKTVYDDKIHLQISIDNGVYTDIPGTEVMLNANNNGWTTYSFPLTAYKTAKRASIAFVGTADGGGNIFIDEFLISDKFENDIEMVALMGVESAKVGERQEYVAQIVNNGTSSTKNYTVDLYLDGEKVDSQTGQGAAIFANGGEKFVTLSFTPRHIDSGRTHDLQAVVNFPGDECAANDKSDVIRLEVPAVELPRVETLNGQVVDGSVNLSWEEPEVSGFIPSTTDDMETYAPFITSNIGNYTLIDNDKSSSTFVISGIQDYANAGGAMAWQVFNPAQAPIDLDTRFNTRWRAHSGGQYLVSFGAAETSANDDWLISPELSGAEQTVSFWIKGVTLAYPESFRVLYSTDTKSMSDFSKVAEATSYTPSSRWRRFSVKLPAGAKYFAIHCISQQAFGLMVDDIRFVPARARALELDFMGYNVYRDGVKLTDTPLGETSFTDNAPLQGTYDYVVTAVFDKGEASPSDVFTAQSGESGVTAVSDNGAVESIVRGGVGCIKVVGAAGAVRVYSSDGRLVGAFECLTDMEIPAESGFYVVSHDGGTAKVVVK